MQSENNRIETLKYILENCLHPEVLDGHPWTQSLIAQDAAAGNPQLKNKTPGQRLAIAIVGYFMQTKPASAPNRALDAEWGVFGALAARYFAPLMFGSPVPASDEATWRQIDAGISSFVFGKSAPPAEQNLYKLIGDRPFDRGALDKWLARGLAQLADRLEARENYLSETLDAPATITRARVPRQHAVRRKKRARLSPAVKALLAGILVSLLGLIGVGAFKAQKIYDQTRVVQNDIIHVQELLAKPETRQGDIEGVGVALSTLRSDVAALKKEAQPFFWMGPMLGWIPERGRDLAQVEDLTTLADSLLAAADLAYQTIAPLIEGGELANANPSELIAFLKKNQPQLSRARQALRQAEAARGKLNLDELSPETRDLIVGYADPAISAMQDSLTVAVELPLIMGAGRDGPQTYLLLVQNEDELRPTGGFITAASAVIVNDGKIGGLNFTNSGELDNWYKIYPAAPWQLREYMNSPVLVFRDSNWHTHYPTAAAYAEYLYSFVANQSVDGVIAFDQHFLVELLRVTGPVHVESVSYPVNADNVVEYMRASKTPDAREAASTAWDNKAFLNDLSRGLLKKIFDGEVEWNLVSAMLLRALNERHLLLQVDNPEMARLLARYHWDGSVQPGIGDFLMVVDTNVGFNKTNAVVASSLAYDVDLGDLSNPRASLAVFHANNAQRNIVCKQWLKNRAEGEKDYPISDCYWNYLRVYMAEGTALLSATPQVVPDAWLINQQKKPGIVDVLQEDIKGTQAFGTLQVIPAGETLAVNFEFALPLKVVQVAERRVTYTLKAQKQPGTLAVPLTLRMHLPKNAVVETVAPVAVVQGSDVLYETDLRTDLEFEIIFSVP